MPKRDLMVQIPKRNLMTAVKPNKQAMQSVVDMVSNCVLSH
jgi:hypothetical protein